MYPIIEIECDNDEWLPVRAHSSDAGADLVCKETVKLIPGQRVLVKTGVKVAILKGYVGLLFPRSSLSKFGITMTNSVGVIDSDYRGEIMASLMYTGITKACILEANTRIVQLVIVPIILPKFQKVIKLSETVRGTGGFGSSG